MDATSQTLWKARVLVALALATIVLAIFVARTGEPPPAWHPAHPIALIPATEPAVEDDPDPLGEMIYSAKWFLYSRQHNGNWEPCEKAIPGSDDPLKSSQWGATTALATWALLACGESPDDPRVRDAIAFLANANIRGAQAIGYRCQVWALAASASAPHSSPSPLYSGERAGVRGSGGFVGLAPPTTPGRAGDVSPPVSSKANSVGWAPPTTRPMVGGAHPTRATTTTALSPADYRRLAQADAARLLKLMRTDGDYRGFFPADEQDAVGYDHIVSQAAVAGLWACRQMGVSIAPQVWRDIQAAWRRHQLLIGGWGETSNAPADTLLDTANGVHVLSLSALALGQAGDASLQRGITSLENGLRQASGGISYQTGHSLADAASGPARYTSADPWRRCARTLDHNQNPEGSWGEHRSPMLTINTSHAMLFLAQARAGVVVNKLRYDAKTPGGWTRRTDDVAGFANWLSAQTGRPLRWQVATLGDNIGSLLEAPILYISGDNEPWLYGPELREYLNWGGLLVASADENNRPFVHGIETIAQQAYENYSFRYLPADHPICRMIAQIAPGAATPAIRALSNGVRELIILVPEHPEAVRAGAVPPTFNQIMAGIYRYAGGRPEAPYYVREWHAAPREDPFGARLRVGRLMHGGKTGDPEPAGWLRMRDLLRKRGISLSCDPIEQSRFSLYHLVHLTGTGRLVLTDNERASLRAYLKSGGTLLIDAAGSDEQFAASAELEVSALFPGQPLRLHPLELSHPVYNTPVKVALRLRGQRPSDEGQPMPLLRVCTLNGRVAIIFSDVDLSAALVGYRIPIRGYDHETAVGLVTNVLLYAGQGREAVDWWPATMLPTGSTTVLPQEATSRSTTVLPREGVSWPVALTEPKFFIVAFPPFLGIEDKPVRDEVKVRVFTVENGKLHATESWVGLGDPIPGTKWSVANIRGLRGWKDCEVMLMDEEGTTLVRRVRADKADPLLELREAEFRFGAVVTRDVSTDPDTIRNALRKGVDHLYATQNAAGHWEAVAAPKPAGPVPGDLDSDQWGARSALAVCALREAGESPQDARLKLALDFMNVQQFSGALPAALRLRNLAFYQLRAQAARNARGNLDTLFGLRGQGEEGRGLFALTRESHTIDMEASALATWALAAAYDNGVDGPRDIWQTADRSWRLAQNADGSWPRGARGEPATTAAGLATLMAIQRQLEGGRGGDCKTNGSDTAINLGVDWIAQNWNAIGRDANRNRILFDLARFATSAGRRTFGPTNWRTAGAEWLLGTQDEAGGWGKVNDTAWAMMFLDLASAPIAINKLQYRIERAGDPAIDGHWNLRPGDVGQFMGWLSREMERKLAWQIVNLDSDDPGLHEAPILYIAGNQTLQVGPAQLARLKEYVDRGGLIVAQADCASTLFSTSFRKLVSALYPQYEFRELPSDDPIYTRQMYAAANWKTRPRILGMSNGVRELILLIPEADPARAWQMRAWLGKEELVQLMANIWLYTTDKQHYYRAPLAPPPAAGFKPKLKAKVARIEFTGNWDPEPGGWRQLAGTLAAKNGLGLEVETLKLGQGKLDKSFALAHLTGTGKLTLNAAERNELAAYLAAGGTLLVDAAGGSAQFADSAEIELSALLGPGDPPLRPMPAQHALFAGPENIRNFVYRRFAMRAMGGAPAVNHLAMAQLAAGGRAYFSREDLSAGLVGNWVDGIIGYDPPTAQAIVTNIIFQAAQRQVGPAPAPAPATRASSP